MHTVFKRVGVLAGFCLPLVGAAASSVAAQSSAAAEAGPRRSAFYMEGAWLDEKDGLLPFRTDAEAIAFLQTAEVVGSSAIPDTSGGPSLLILEKDGMRARAIFRTVDVERAKVEGPQSLAMGDVREHIRGLRDWYMFEMAAFELSRLLGLDNVPPTTLRKLGSQEGSLQLWVEHALGVQERMEQGIDQRLQQLWAFQKQNMAVFDNLIYNFDRNPGNMLLDPRGKLWFVDHTRSFKRLPVLRDRDDIQVIERPLWENLQALDPAVVRERLEPYVDAPEIDALMSRRNKLVKLISRRIAKHGEQAIVFEILGS